MSNFLKDAQGELEHVVWPTNNETKRYMLYTVWTIVVMATILAVLGFGFQQSLRAVRGVFPHDQINTTVSGEATTTEDVNNILENVTKKKTLSGPTHSGKTSVSGEKTLP